MRSLLGNDTQLNLEFPHFSFVLAERKDKSLHVQTVVPLTCSRIYQVEQEFRQKPFKFQLIIIKPHRRGEAPIFFLPEFPILSNLFV